jgi:GMP synthase (glutamine-hydrolysing)
MPNRVLILDFGSQYTQLIARRVRELNVFCEIFPYNSKNFDVKDYSCLIFSGSPFSVMSKDCLDIDFSDFIGKIPLLGICYGAQYLAHKNGGEVSPSSKREYGRARLISINKNSKLLKGIDNGSQVWMSHADTITKLPPKSKKIGSTEDVENACFEFDDQLTYGIQFHPEVYHSSDGKTLLKNFIIDISKVNPNWTPSSFVEKTVLDIKSKIKNDRVILGLSGGVDSSVAAVLLNKSIGNNLTCLFIDNGLLRKNEFDEVLENYKGMGLNVVVLMQKKNFTLP